VLRCAARSSKSAMHGLIHWLAGAYAKKGITVNGVAPALIGETKMLPENSQELAKSKSPPQVQGSESHDRGLVGARGPDHDRLHPTCSSQLKLTLVKEYRWVSLVDLTKSQRLWYGWSRPGTLQIRSSLLMVGCYLSSVAVLPHS
jgi:hypothetical protein